MLKIAGYAERSENIKRKAQDLFVEAGMNLKNPNPFA